MADVHPCHARLSTNLITRDAHYDNEFSHFAFRFQSASSAEQLGLHIKALIYTLQSALVIFFKFELSRVEQFVSKHEEPKPRPNVR